jgi:hypothetical protein
MWLSPEIAEAAIAGQGRRWGLALAGWDRLSVWGWDSADQSLFAQMYRNGQDGREPPPGNQWITPPRYPQTGAPEQLAASIAAVTGASVREVLEAMADSLGTKGARLREAAQAAQLPRI